MNISTKAQIETLKALECGNRVFFGESKDNAGYLISNDGKCAFFIFKSKFFLDKNKLNNVNFNFYFDDLMSCEKPLAIYTGEIKELKDIKMNVAKLKHNNSTTVFVDVKCLKRFGKPNTLVLKNENQKSPVYVYNKEMIPLGLIMPVRVKE